MTCYLRHLRAEIEASGRTYDAGARARVDEIVRAFVDAAPTARCPEVWAAVKALDPERRAELGRTIAR